MTEQPNVSARPLTPWEQLLKTVVGAVVEQLPNIIRNGYRDGGTDFPPLTNVQLPDLDRYDTGQQLALCPLLAKPVTNTLLSVSGNRLNGLDTIRAFGEVSFPEQDIRLSIPLLFREISLTGNWKSEGECKRGSAPAATTVHNGTYRVRYADVQITLDVTLDPDASSAAGVAARLTDTNGTWKDQPDFDPAADVTFDGGTSTGQRTVLTALLRSDDVRAQFRGPVKEVVESERLADEIKRVINAMLAQLG